MDKQAYFKMMGLDKQAAIDPELLKQLFVGAGAGLGTYALSSFLPGARQSRLARLLASLGVGLGAGYFGNNIFNYFTKKPAAPTASPAVPNADAQAAIQELVTPPAAPVKTPDQIANQIYAAGRQAAGAKSQPVEPIKAPERKLAPEPEEKPAQNKVDKTQTPNMTIDGKAKKKNQPKMEKKNSYAEQLSTAMQKQAYFKLMGYSGPVQNS